MRRWLPPLEADRRLIETLHRSRPAGVETEVFVFGKLPLAFSARCFTARHYNLNKDDCQFKCLDHPEGMTLRTREGQPFLTINGIQTMSAQTCNLLAQVPEMLAMGVEVVRISPQPRAWPRSSPLSTPRAERANRARHRRLGQRRAGRRLLVRRSRHREHQQATLAPMEGTRS
jgi:hypothetical protein